VCHTWAAVTSLPLSKHTGGGGATPVFSDRLVYLQFHEGVSLPHSLEPPALFATCLFFSAACLLFSLFFSLFFPLGGGHSVRGLC
jgi:hypothetical protein